MFGKKLICFDLDNTLLLSDKSHVEAYSYALKKMGHKEWDYSQLTGLFGRPKFEMAKILTRSSSPEDINEFLRLHHDYIARVSYKHAEKVAGLDEALEKIKKKYILAVLSNATHNDIKHLMKGAGLSSKYFRIIVGSDEVEHSKPYPDELIKVEKLLKHKPEYMVGDSIYDLIAAKHASVKGIGVLTGHYNREMLSDYRPVAVLNSVAELPEFLKV